MDKTTNTILLFDETDDRLGFFFNSCQNDINNYFNQTNHSPVYINSNRINDLLITTTTEPLDKFVFGAYSHGDTDCLVKANRPYISTAINNLNFENSFFYTFSCSCGAELGSNLVDNGCLCFIGYNKIIYIYSTYIKPFVECANHGLLLFYSGDSTYDVIKKMKIKYTEEIDSIYKANPMIASILRDNRDALVVYGQNISIGDLSNT